MFRITESDLRYLQRHDGRYKEMSMAEVFHYVLREHIESRQAPNDFISYMQKSAQYFLSRTYRDLQLVIFPDSSFLKMRLSREYDSDKESYNLSVRIGRYNDIEEGISRLYSSSSNDFEL